MSEPPKDAAAETSIQRALRMKQEALRAKQKPPGADARRDPNAGVNTGASKPWMKR
jgi:hypothetical protein